MKKTTFLALVLAGVASWCGAADLGGALRKQIEAAPNGWIGYELPTERRHSVFCSGADRDDGRAAVLIRIENHRIDRVRLSSPPCEQEEARNVTWIAAVDPRANVEFLDALVRQNDDDDWHALAALALSRGATDSLIDIARHHPSARLRGKALFWVGQQAGEKAAAALRDAVENDPEEDVKAKAVFGISNLPNEESVPLLIDLMKNNHSPAVRRKAAFWLGQKRDPRALEAFEEILTK